MPDISAAQLALSAFLVLGASLRLARFLTTDSLGEWLIREPLLRWAARHEAARRTATGRSDEGPISWQARLYEGVRCPFCVSFWVGAGLVAATALVLLLPAPAWLSIAWHLLLAALTLNYFVGHISSRID